MSLNKNYGLVIINTNALAQDTDPYLFPRKGWDGTKRIRDHSYVYVWNECVCVNMKHTELRFL